MLLIMLLSDSFNKLAFGGSSCGTADSGSGVATAAARITAVALVRSLAQELPHAVARPKIKIKKKRERIISLKKKKKLAFFYVFLNQLARGILFISIINKTQKHSYKS